MKKQYIQPEAHEIATQEELPILTSGGGGGGSTDGDPDDARARGESTLHLNFDF